MKIYKKKIILWLTQIFIMISVISCGGVKLQYEKKKLTFNDIDYGFEVKYADLGEKYGKIAYADEGTGSKTFLFIHGVGNYLKYFYYQIKHLKQNYRVIALDMPGYGKSTINSETEYNIPFHAMAISEFIKKLGLNNLVVVGHSYGANVAVAVSFFNKKIVKNAIFIAPGGGLQKFNYQTVSYIKSNMNRLVEDETSIDYDLDNFINKWHDKYVYHRTQITDNYLKEYLGIIYSRDIDKMWQTRTKVIKFGYSRTGDYQLIDMFKKMEYPVLVLLGDNDKVVPAPEAPSWSRENAEYFLKNIVSLNNRASYKIIKNCGHMPVIERPDEVNKAIDEFVSQNE